MKKIILFLTISLFTVTSFSQTLNPTLTKDHYLQKSKNKETAGWILLAGGTTMAVIGIAAFSSNSDSGSAADLGGFLILGGIITDLVSIPFFVSSAKNARKAATISFNSQKLIFPQYSTSIVKTIPSITLRIRL